MRVCPRRPSSSGWTAAHKMQALRADLQPRSTTFRPCALMKAILLSLKSRCSRPVIKMWQAVAHVSVRRHAPCLATFFDHGVETLRPTQGSLSAEEEHSEDSPIKILHLFFEPAASAS